MSASESAAKLPGRRRRRLAVAVLALGALVLGFHLAFRALESRRSAHAAFPITSGRIEAAGLEARIEILRDRHGVPHVRAGSEADAYWGLGFAHAQDRLGQMLWLRHTARGRRAELVGPAALPADRLARTLGIGRHADAQVERLDRATRTRLDAYARGVNARIARVREGQAGLPVALAGHREALEEWTPGDSLALVKLYAWGLSGTLDVSLVLSDLITRLGGFGARPFFPGGERFLAVQRAALEPERRAPHGRPAGWLGGDPLRRAARLSGRHLGSSAFVVGGRHAADGRPLLVADSHLETTVPAFFYPAHVAGGGLDVAGATLPGVPVVWIGHNRQVAWAATHARAVTTDLYVETRSPSDPRRYHAGSGWRILTERSETLRVRGRPDETLVVRETDRGPLVSQLVGETETVLSLAWSGAQPGDGVSALLRAARADTAEAFRAALASHHEPVLSFVFADHEGDAGLQVAGWVPSRPSTALVPVPGRDASRRWKRGIEFSRLPQARLEDDRGWLVAADGPLGLAGEQDVEWLWRTGERASRIEALLLEATQAGPLDLRRLAQFAADVHTPHGRRVVEAVTQLAGDSAALGRQEREVLGRLRSWDHQAAAESVGAGVYEVFLQQLMPDLWRDALGAELLERYLALPHANPVALAAELLAIAVEGREPPDWTDAARIRGAVLRALRETWIRLSVRMGASPERWEWGRLHLLRFRPLADPPRDLGEGVLGPRPYPGNALTVATAEFDRRQPFEVRVASTFRLAADTAALDTVLCSLAPGQSEHPGHRHYTDGVQPWLDHRLQLLASGPLLLDEVATQRLLVEPRP